MGWETQPLRVQAGVEMAFLTHDALRIISHVRYRHLQAFELPFGSVFPVVAFLKPLHIEFMEFFLI